MKDLKLGLVLSGGGAKGAYQLGIWKAMEEFDLSKHVVAVSGSSVGALNGFMFTYSNYKSAEDVWLKQVDSSKFFRSKGSRWQSQSDGNSNSLFMGWMPNFDDRGGESIGLASTFMGSLYRRDDSMGLFSNSGIDELIRLASQDLDYGRECCPSMHVCAYEFMTQQPRYFSLDAFANLLEAKKALLASSAIPLAFPPIKIKGMHYYDGGCIDNIPVRPIHDRNLDMIIVVNIEGAATPYDLMSRYPYTNILEIKPFNRLGGLLSEIDFNSSFINTCFKQGYEQGYLIFRDLLSSLSNGMEITVARSQVQSYINDNLDPYTEDTLSLESLCANLRDVFMATGEGLNISFPTLVGDVFWEEIDNHNGYKLQKNSLSQHCRILDIDNFRISYGSEIVQTYKFWQLSKARYIDVPDISDIIKSIDLANQSDVPDLDTSFMNNIEFDI